MAKRKTILIIEVDKNEWNIKYTGSLLPTEDKEVFKLDARLMNMLTSDDRVLEFWNRILQPVLRYKRREARRNAKNVVK